MRVGLLVRKLSCLKRVTDTLVGGVVRAFSDELPSEDLEEEMGDRLDNGRAM